MMEIIKNDELNRILEDHKKAVKGDTSFKEVEVGFLYKKQVNDFVFHSIEGLTSQPIQDSVFLNCIFYKVELYYSQFQGSTFQNCLFNGCTFVKSEMLKVTLKNCLFANCNFFRTILDGEVSNCVFIECNLNKMILTDAKITNTIFSGETNSPNTEKNEEHNVIWDIKRPV